MSEELVEQASSPEETSGGEASAPAEQPPSFLDLLPEDMRVDTTFSKFKDVGGLAKSYKNLETMMSADKNDLFRIPKDGDLAEVYNRLGRPESADKYRSEAFNNDKVKQFFNEETANSYKELFHEHGASQELYDTLMQKYVSEFSGDIDQMTTQRNERLAKNHQSVKEMLGDAYDSRIQIIDSFFEKYGGEDFSKVVDAHPEVFSDPAVVKLFAEIAPQFTEDSGFKGGERANSGGMTPAEINMKIAELEGNPEAFKALSNRQHPLHNKYSTERNKLYEIRAKARK